jgi:hypothetical protein
MGLAKYIHTLLEEHWDNLDRQESLEFYCSLCVDGCANNELDPEKVADWVIDRMNDYGALPDDTADFLKQCINEEIRRIIDDEPEEILDELKNWFQHEFN